QLRAILEKLEPHRPARPQAIPGTTPHRRAQPCAADGGSAVLSDCQRTSEISHHGFDCTHRKQSGGAVALLRQTGCSARMDEVTEVLAEIGGCLSFGSDHFRRFRVFNELAQIPCFKWPTPQVDFSPEPCSCRSDDLRFASSVLKRQ